MTISEKCSFAVGTKSFIEVREEVKMVNYVNYEVGESSGERWLAGSGFRVTLGDVDINRPNSLLGGYTHTILCYL